MQYKHKLSYALGEGKIKASAELLKYCSFNCLNSPFDIVLN